MLQLRKRGAKAAILLPPASAAFNCSDSATLDRSRRKENENLRLGLLLSADGADDFARALISFDRYAILPEIHRNRVAGLDLAHDGCTRQLFSLLVSYSIHSDQGLGGFGPTSTSRRFGH